jgi:hypothetical protein
MSVCSAGCRPHGSESLPQAAEHTSVGLAARGRLCARSGLQGMHGVQVPPEWSPRRQPQSARDRTAVHVSNQQWITPLDSMMPKRTDTESGHARNLYSLAKNSCRNAMTSSASIASVYTMSRSSCKQRERAVAHVRRSWACRVWCMQVQRYARSCQGRSCPGSCALDVEDSLAVFST